MPDETSNVFLWSDFDRKQMQELINTHSDFSFKYWKNEAEHQKGIASEWKALSEKWRTRALSARRRERIYGTIYLAIIAACVAKVIWW